jgi:hypothetical protein
VSAKLNATPLLLNAGETPVALPRIAVGTGKYDELFVQKLAFDHPSCLPISDIDRTYERLVPICMELNTSAGRLDAFYATPTGRLVLLEAKLWRNPEARREVVAQILDYARELSSWDYDDLQREVSRRTGRKGNALYNIIAARYPDVVEAEFVDEVQRSLRNGRFLLLILGDGIREGAGAIASFLHEHGSLEFTFGLVELALYKFGDQGLLLVPHVIAQSVIIDRRVVSLPEGAVLVEAGDAQTDDDVAEELTDSNRFYQRFWQEFTQQLKLDDPGQPIPKSTKIGNLYFTMPPSGGVSWVGLFFSKRNRSVGVYLTFTKGTFGDRAYAELYADRTAIEDEMGRELDWESVDGKHVIAIRREFDDIWASTNREAIKTFLAETANRFVNVFRPRLKRLTAEND